MLQPRFAVLRADMGRELDNVRRLVAEAEEWSEKLADYPDVVRVRTGGGILHDFYCGKVWSCCRGLALMPVGDLGGAQVWACDEDRSTVDKLKDIVHDATDSHPSIDF